MIRKKRLLILVVGLFLFIFETLNLNAETFEINTISVEGNNRLSDEAISNYSRLNLNETVSVEALDSAYKNIVATGLFRNVIFNRQNQKLTILVEEYPTVNEISFEGNKKFTDEKLSPL